MRLVNRVRKPLETLFDRVTIFLQHASNFYGGICVVTHQTLISVT